MDMKEKKTGKGNNFPTNCREVQQMKDMEINEKIRYFRKQRGLSQELLAERTGINVNTIRKYEIGIRKPKVEQLKKIADYSIQHKDSSKTKRVTFAKRR